MSRVTIKNGTAYFKCPGCAHTHGVAFERQDGKPVWAYNGDANRPTFSPSLLVTGGCRVEADYHARHDDPDDACDLKGPERFRMCFTCHSFIRDGRIEFLSDCTHDLAGQTVDLPEGVLWAD
jgi:hypothetical protein